MLLVYFYIPQFSSFLLDMLLFSSDWLQPLIDKSFPTSKNLMINFCCAEMATDGSRFDRSMYGESVIFIIFMKL